MTREIQQAVILAAGTSQRLQEVLPDRPKGLLDFGQGPIVERSIQKLLAVGIRQIVLVTGYQEKHYEALAARHPAVTTVSNDRFAESGSMHSLYRARDHLGDGFLLLESDLVYESRALTELLAFPEDDAVLISGFTHARDEVFIEGSGGRIARMSKEVTSRDHVVGEQVGISKLSRDLLDRMIEHAEVHFQRDLHLDYEVCLSEICERNALHYCLVEDLLWAEIDDAGHFRRVRDQVHPELIRRAEA